MPIFEYCCRQCGQQFERLSWGSEQKPTCGCGSQAVERIWYSRVAVATGARTGDAPWEGGCCGAGEGETCGSGACCGNGACADFDA